MGQTLTHGIYLPDEGERNCYNGLAANWQLLDGAVGTIAEHTTALAGKAPLVHTHTKSDITDFPVYGTTAGTICEGNDSRLSDARTPVAHTHSKADITDLFNSVNTWTALNSYNQSIQITANFDIGTAPSSDVYGGFNFGNGTSNIGNITSRINSSGATYSRLYIGNKFANGTLDPNGTWKYVELQVGLRANGDRFIYTDGLWRNNLIPYDSTVSIGDSNHQWNNLYAKRVNTQSVNGVNPGALSFPSGNNSDAITVDITDWYIQDPDYPDDPTKKILDAANHKVDTAVPGWLHINFPNVAGNWAYARKYAAGTNMDLQRIADGAASSDFVNVALIFPIYLSCYVRIKAKTATVRIFPCLGNV